MLGVALINEFIKSGVQVLAIARQNSTKLNKLPRSPLIDVLECDLSHLEDIGRLKQEYDAFYHFAWDGTSKASRSDFSHLF